jgi:hypothetical protein
MDVGVSKRLYEILVNLVTQKTPSHGWSQLVSGLLVGYKNYLRSIFSVLLS